MGISTKKKGRVKTAKKEKTNYYHTVRIKKHYDNKGNHNHVILEDFEDKHVSVGLTSKTKKGKNSPNYKCENDVLGGKTLSYLRRQAIVDKIKNYSRDESQGKMTNKDFLKAKEYGAKAKEKYLKKKK